MRLSYIFIACVLVNFLSNAQAEEVKLLDVLEGYKSTKISTIYPNGAETYIKKGLRIENNKSFELIQTRKAPDKVRFEYELDGVKTSVGYNGDIGWQRQDQGDSLSIREYLVGKFDWLKLSADFYGYLLRSMQGDSTITLRLLGDVMEEGRTAHVIEALDGSNISIKYFISSASYYLLKTEISYPDGSLIERTKYMDYRKVDGIPLSHRQITVNAEGLESLSIWDEIALNQVVYDFIFEKPKF